MAVLLETSFGDLVIDLFPEKAKKACINFVKLCKMKFYNNALFIDVQKDRLVKISQPSRPATSIYEIISSNKANKYFEDEIHPELMHDKYGLVSTGNVGPNMNASDVMIITF